MCMLKYIIDDSGLLPMYTDSINGKDVLVFDDAIGTVGVVSESADAILKMFYPKSITFVTLY